MFFIWHFTHAKINIIKIDYLNQCAKYIFQFYNYKKVWRVVFETTVSHGNTMDIRKFKVRQPEPAELFTEFGEVDQDDVIEYTESCKIAKHVISMFTDDTRTVQEAGSRISSVIDKWCNSDTSLEKMCEVLM